MNLEKLSCRECVFSSLEAALKGIKEAGLENIELQIKETAALADAIATSRSAGVTPLTVAGGVECDSEDSVETVAKVIDIISAAGVEYYFLSVIGEVYSIAVEVMKKLGDSAAAKNVTLCMETHPPFCENAEKMLKGMADINSPAVRVNFDTANIFYYNENIDSADELEKVIDYVSTVHLKDTNGGFKSMDFPLFGDGVVKFGRIASILDAAGFSGPLTIELEGEVIRPMDDTARTEALAKCVNYLKSL
jgi:sugar phosphate isomerase/epimerase